MEYFIILSVLFFIILFMLFVVSIDSISSDIDSFVKTYRKSIKKRK